MAAEPALNPQPSGHAGRRAEYALWVPHWVDVLGLHPPTLTSATWVGRPVSKKSSKPIQQNPIN